MGKQEFNFHQHTRFMFVGSKVLVSPLEAMYGLLAFIFCKDLNATPLQITLLVSLKPIVALLSFYGNLIIKDRPHKLKSLILWANGLSLLPCFLFPFVSNIWFFLFSYALFMTSLRAVIPAWAEILKINLSPHLRGKIFSQGSSANYLINIFIPLAISPLIDAYPPIWKWIFFALALLNVLTIFLTLCIQVKDGHAPPAPSAEVDSSYQLTSFRSMILGPWKSCWTLMKQRPDFKKFQIVFMLGGAGLMVMQPALPVFFKDLQLSYTQLTLATSLCKGIAFALTSQVWANWINRIPIHLFNACVTAFAGLFAVLISGSAYYAGWIYPAYLIYGTMQAGSELSWNLSGPIFAQEKDSTLFTGINVAMVGLRGCIAPFLGGLMLVHSQASSVFIIGGCLCMMGSLYSLWLNWSYETRACLQIANRLDSSSFRAS